MGFVGQLQQGLSDLLRETPVAGAARGVRDVAEGLRAHALAPRLRRMRCGAGLVMYHGVEPQVRDHLVEGVHTTARLFRAQLRHLKRHYRVVALAEVVERLHDGREVPDDWAVLTFDDGYRNNLTCAREIARQEGDVPLSVFVVSDFVGTRTVFWTARTLMALLYGRGATLRVPARGGGLRTAPSRSRRERAILYSEILPILKGLTAEERAPVLEEYFDQFGDGEVEEIRDSFPSFDWLSWDEVRELASGGVDIGSHTRTHTYLRQELDPATMRDEIFASRDALAEELGAPPAHFAYPNGSVVDHCEASHRMLREAGYRCGITTMHGTVVAGADPYTLNRIPWCANSMARFRFANAAARRL